MVIRRMQQSTSPQATGQVKGEYEFGLQRAGDNWQITSVKLNRKAEQGSRDVLAEAPKYAAQNLKTREALKVTYQ